jgi:phosphatidylinositol N-acetylglucosaminyltransferase subunit C
MLQFVFDPFDGRRVVLPPLSVSDEEGETFPKEDPSWRRVLYQKQSMPDNYVSTSFLKSLRRPRAETFAFWETVKKTACIANHLAFIALFILIWHSLRWFRMPVEYLIGIDLFLLAISYLSRNALDRLSTVPANKLSILKEGISSIYVFGTVWILSPVLKTLTLSWSENTIYAMAVILMVIHAFLHDYGYIYRQNIGSPIFAWCLVDNPLSMNAAMFAAIMLASRLETITHVFAFEFLAITGFMLSPTFPKLIYTKSQEFYTGYFSIAVFFVTSVILFKYGETVHMGILYITGVFLVCFICPGLFVKMQSLRTELRGPWDIAHVKCNINSPTDAAKHGKPDSLYK